MKPTFGGFPEPRKRVRFGAQSAAVGGAERRIVDRAFFRRIRPMTSLDATLSAFLRHPGVEQIILLGRDGLVVRQMGADAAGEEAIAAEVPALVAGCRRIGAAADRGGFQTAVIELDRGVLIVLSISSELSMAILLRPGTGFATLLRDLRGRRRELLDLI